MVIDRRTRQGEVVKWARRVVKYIWTFGHTNRMTELIMMKRDSFLFRERGVMHNYKNVQLIYSYID